MKIDEYSFGHIVIDDKSYKDDVIIFHNHVKSHWMRKEGHFLTLSDLKSALLKKPKMLIIGTGHDGCMGLSNEVKEYCAEHGIDLVVRLTADAVKAYNELEGKKVIAALHLTC